LNKYSCWMHYTLHHSDSAHTIHTNNTVLTAPYCPSLSHVQVIELPYTHPHLFEALNITPPKVSTIHFMQSSLSSSLICPYFVLFCSYLFVFLILLLSRTSFSTYTFHHFRHIHFFPKLHFLSLYTSKYSPPLSH
jgi:hypothetical protein